MSSKKVNLTIGIPTCRREKAITTCLDSIMKNVKIPFKLLIVDNTKAFETPKINLKELYHIDKYIEVEKPVGPSTSRRIIAENTDTEYLLFLDDDIIVRKYSVEKMMEHIEKNENISIVSGAWYDRGIYEFGQRFNFGMKNGKKIVYKTFLKLEDVQDIKLDSVRLDGGHATMLCRTKIFNKVNFDDQYKWFYELYDFFMQCYENNLIIESLPDVIFEHRPLTYKGKTMRVNKDIEGRNIFINKWGIEPVGRLRRDLNSFTRMKRKLIKRLEFITNKF